MKIAQNKTEQNNEKLKNKCVKIVSSFRMVEMRKKPKLFIEMVINEAKKGRYKFSF